MLIVIDTREQMPLEFPGVCSVRGTLASGDYSAQGLEDRCAVERKSLADLAMSVSRERERFWREIERLARMPSAAVVVEAPFVFAMQHRYRANVHPNALIASCMAIQIDYGVPVMWMGDRESAAAWTLAYLRLAMKRYSGDTLPGAKW